MGIFSKIAKVGRRVLRPKQLIQDGLEMIPIVGIGFKISNRIGLTDWVLDVVIGKVLDKVDDRIPDDTTAQYIFDLAFNGVQEAAPLPLKGSEKFEFAKKHVENNLDRSIWDQIKDQVPMLIELAYSAYKVQYRYDDIPKRTICVFLIVAGTVGLIKTEMNPIDVLFEQLENRKNELLTSDEVSDSTS